MAKEIGVALPPKLNMRLISVLKSLRHPNIVSIEKCSEVLTTACLYIVVAHCLGAACVRHCSFAGWLSEAEINIPVKESGLTSLGKAGYGGASGPTHFPAGPPRPPFLPNKFARQRANLDG